MQGTSEAGSDFLQFYVPQQRVSRVLYRDRFRLSDWATASLLIDIASDGPVRRQKLKLPGYFRCGPRTNPLAAWEANDIAELFADNGLVRSTVVQNLREKFAELRKTPFERAYIFGTGNSLGDAATYDWSDGYRIVCNTIVKNSETWESLKPHAIVAADGLYHFSESSHALRFRQDLRARFREQPALFFYPQRFHTIVSRELGEYAKWLVPMPEGGQDDLCTAVDQAGGIPRGVGNILNILLLPIACSLAKDVRLVGFDGRRPEDKHFWKNSDSHSYPELIDELSQEYPAFFEDHVPKSDPQKYVRTSHGEELERRLAQAEAHGWEFHLLFESTTVTLQRRFDASCRPPKRCTV